VLPEPVLPEPVLPEPVLPEPVLPEPVLPEPARAVVEPVPRTKAPGTAFWPARSQRLLPEATLKRLPLYLGALAEANDERQVTISSDELAARVGVNAAQVRKDLSYLGSYGTRGVGYGIEQLSQHINHELGLDREYKVALVGAGNLGQALGNYRGFADRGFRVVAVFDSDPAKVGRRLGNAEVHALSELPRVVRQMEITVALIATPAAVAQDVVERLVGAGVTSVLNFAPTVLNVAPEVSVRRVDLAVELQILGYYQHSRRKAPRAQPAATATATAS